MRIHTLSPAVTHPLSSLAKDLFFGASSLIDIVAILSSGHHKNKLPSFY